MVTRKRRLETTTIDSTVIGKEEDVLDMTKSTESLTIDEESFVAKKYYWRL